MSRDRNYINVEQSGTNAKAERVGDITGEPATNKALDKDEASRLANLLEYLEFPATKKKIINHLNQKSSAVGNRINNVLAAVKNNLDDDIEYRSAYDIEIASGLVERTASEKPYVRDRALNRANRNRIGESSRPDPYTGQENIRPANARDGSPNTPKGEDV